MARYDLKLNGRIVTVDVLEDTPLLWVLRDTLALQGTKFGCGVGVCGACTVLADGRATRSCVVPIAQVGDAAITTIEGLSATPGLSGLQRAWIAEQVPQCGYCQPGMIMAVAGLLRDRPAPTAEDLARSITNVCRCGTHPRIRRAVARAARA